MSDVLLVLMRWLHISSMATLIGGILYWRLVLEPSLRGLATDAANAVSAKAAAAYRPIVWAAMTSLILSGVFNLMANPGHKPTYHMLLGIKILLAGHVFAMAFLITKPINPRRSRLMTGAVISGLTILAISAYLRRIF